MPLLVKILAFLRLLIIPFCRDLTSNLMLDKIVKHPTAASAGSRAVLACGAHDWLATDGRSDAPDVGLNILAGTFGGNLLIGVRVAILLGDHCICFALQLFLFLA